MTNDDKNRREKEKRGKNKLLIVYKQKVREWS